jgi:predicted nucleic acid-binding Zn ribbon protein
VSGSGDNPDGSEPDRSEPDRSEPDLAVAQVTPLSTANGGKAGRAVDGAQLSGRDLARAALADAQAMAARRRADKAAGIHPRVQRRRRRNLEANNARRSWSGAGADERDPQPLGALMQNLFAERGWNKAVTEASVFTDWPRLVGGDIADHCQPTALHNGELKITAQSSAWATQLRLLAPRILGRLADELGAGIVTRMVVTGPSGPSWKHGLRSVPGARGPRDTYG